MDEAHIHADGSNRWVVTRSGRMIGTISRSKGSYTAVYMNGVYGVFSTMRAAVDFIEQRAE